MGLNRYMEHIHCFCIQSTSDDKICCECLKTKDQVLEEMRQSAGNTLYIQALQRHFDCEKGEQKMLIDQEFFTKSKVNTFNEWKERYDKVKGNFEARYNFLKCLENIYSENIVREFECKFRII